MSAPIMDVNQQSQMPLSMVYASAPMMTTDMGALTQWQPVAAQQWGSGIAAPAHMQFQSVVMMPVVFHPGFPAADLPVASGTPGTFAPCQHFAGSTFEQSSCAGEVQFGCTPQIFMTPTPGLGHWQMAPTEQPAPLMEQPTSHVVVLPLCSEDSSLVQQQRPHAPMDPARSFSAISCGEFAHGQGAAQVVTGMPNQQRVQINLADGLETLSDISTVSTPPGPGFCTPELTPRYGMTSEAESRRVQCLSAKMLQECATQQADAAQTDFPPSSLLERASSVDELSECGESLDEVLDIYVIPTDSKSYASSDTASTVVSRSARRRRGRRAAKAKAANSTKGLVEVPSPEELLVSKERKSELVQQLEAGGKAMQAAMSSIRGSALRMSLEPFGCRAIQAALEVSSLTDKEAIADEFRGHVLLAAASPHANFVIQKVIEVLPVSVTDFVAEELATFAAEVARHRFGCRIFSRLVEHHLCSVASPATDDLVDELLLQTNQLIQHNFARHVLELILEHGSDANRHSIAETIRSNLFDYAKNRSASYVVEKALVFCRTRDKKAIVSVLLAQPQRFLTLAVHECGIHVVKAAVKTNTDSALKAKEMLLADAERLKSSKYGKRLLDEM